MPVARTAGSLKINANLAIPEDELAFTFSRSGGPGGQHVNKTSTRVTLYFDVESSPSLTSEEKARLREKLGTRLSKRGILLVVSQKHRSQSANKREAIDRFVRLLHSALKKTRPRKPTHVPESVKQRRLQEKAVRARIKAFRSSRVPPDE